VLLGPLLLGERFRPRDAALLAAVAAGLGLCLSGGAASTVTAPDPSTGNVVAALCGVTWALTLVGLRWGERRHAGTASTTVIAGNLFACLGGLPLLWPPPAASPVDWATLGYLGVFQIGVAYLLLTAALAHLPALHVSLLLLLEPVLNPVWAWLVRGEDPGGRALLGGAIILVGSAGQVLSDGRTPETAAKTQT
jgi:drug/metabolite transporter (DMT)-like permease